MITHNVHKLEIPFRISGEILNGILYLSELSALTFVLCLWFVYQMVIDKGLEALFSQLTAIARMLNPAKWQFWKGGPA